MESMLNPLLGIRACQAVCPGHFGDGAAFSSSNSDSGTPGW